MGRGLLFAAVCAVGLASTPLVTANRQLQQDGSPGTCTEVHKVSGYALEDDQDETSLQVSAAMVMGTPAYVAVKVTRNADIFWGAQTLLMCVPIRASESERGRRS